MASSKPARLYPKRSWKEEHEEDLIIVGGFVVTILVPIAGFLAMSLEAVGL